MNGKINSLLANSLIIIACGLLSLWAGRAFPIATQHVVDIVGAGLYWPEKPALELRSLVQAANNWVLERKTLQDRNKELEIQNLTMRTAIQKLGKQVPATSADLIGARVTLRYPDEWWKEVRIDCGSKQGVKVGAAAISEGFLIGKVSRVGEDYAWIELITSSSFLLAAVVEETWDLGVVNGDDRGNIWLMYIQIEKAEKDFKKGMMVSTALVGEQLPPGIPIGRIWGPGEPREGFLPQKIASGAHLTQLYTLQILRTRDGADK